MVQRISQWRLQTLARVLFAVFASFLTISEAAASYNYPFLKKIYYAIGHRSTHGYPRNFASLFYDVDPERNLPRPACCERFRRYSQVRVTHGPPAGHLVLDSSELCDVLATNSQEMARYMPDELCEIKKLPRGWIINVGASVVGKPFLDWIKEKITERNEKQTSEKNLLIKMDPQLAAAFNNSTYHSSK